MGADVHEGVFGLLELDEDARFVGIEGVAQRGERLADAVGMLQHRELLLDFGLLARAEVGRRELLDLKAQPLLVAPPLFGRLAQGGNLALQLREAGIVRRVAFEQRAVAGHGVDGRRAELLRGEDQVLML